jgi:TetR/AcrR family transcriptional regulator, transcriptional repressor for nem operon
VKIESTRLIAAIAQVTHVSTMSASQKNWPRTPLAAAKLVAQAHGYAGLNFRDLAQQVGIKAASIYYHFPSKAELATAVAKRYWEDSAAYLESLLQNSAKPLDALRRYPETFRWALENDNRICLCSFMSAQFDDLPEAVKTEVQAFTDVNLA